MGSLAGPGRVVVTTAPDDTTNPPQMQEWVVAQIPGAQLLPQAVPVSEISCICLTCNVAAVIDDTVA